MTDDNNNRALPPALTRAQMDDYWFTEELELLRIDKNRIFRWAIGDDYSLPELPDFEAELTEELDVEEALTDLDEARDGKDAVTAEIAKWREELAAA